MIKKQTSILIAAMTSLLALSMSSVEARPIAGNKVAVAVENVQATEDTAKKEKQKYSKAKSRRTGRAGCNEKS